MCTLLPTDLRTSAPEPQLSASLRVCIHSPNVQNCQAVPPAALHISLARLTLRQPPWLLALGPLVDFDLSPPTCSLWVRSSGSPSARSCVCELFLFYSDTLSGLNHLLELYAPHAASSSRRRIFSRSSQLEGQARFSSYVSASAPHFSSCVCINVKHVGDGHDRI